MLTNLLLVLTVIILLLGVLKMSQLSDAVANLTTAVTDELAAVKAILSQTPPDVAAAIAQIDTLTQQLNDETTAITPPPAS